MTSVQPPTCNEAPPGDTAAIDPICFLRPLAFDDAADRALALSWLQRDKVAKWLDFGNGRTTITEGQFAFMVKNPNNVIQFFCDTTTGEPLGIAALQGVRHAAGVAEQWGVRCNMTAGRRGAIIAAIHLNLAYAFDVLKLNCVQAWCVECNRVSLASTVRAGFREMGRQRCAHLIDGTLHDRLLLDITAAEFSQQRERRRVT